jgi:two-component system sensor histidine kinase MtrB
MITQMVVWATIGAALLSALTVVFVFYRVSHNVVSQAQLSAQVDANQAINQIEQLLADSQPALTAGQIYEVAAIAVQRSWVGGYYISFHGTNGDFSTSGLAVDQSFPTALRERVQAEPDRMHGTPIELVIDQRTVPGYAVATAVDSGPDRFELYLGFSFERENRLLETIRGVLILAASIITVGVGLVAFIIGRITLAPIRVTRHAAERLASGHLNERMQVRGDDDVARLARSMNRMASQLSQRIYDLERLSRMQQQFVSNVSHELRTPLTTIRMASELLYGARDKFPAFEARAAELLLDEVERTRNMVIDLLEISRFDIQTETLRLEETDLVDLTEHVITGLELVAQAHGSTIRLIGGASPDSAGGAAPQAATEEADAAEPSTALVVPLDTRRYNRVLTNLLTNAIVYGAGHPIEVRVAANDTTVALTVRDWGIGFDAEQAPHLFDRFWRADPARPRELGGTGLGLTIALENARLHQGRIEAWSRPGEGAQFRLLWPRHLGQPMGEPALPLRPPGETGGVIASQPANLPVVLPKVTTTTTEVVS